MVKELKVGICVPCMGTVRVEFMRSLVALTSHFLQTKIPGYPANRYTLLTTQGSMLVQLRHNLVQSALKEKCTHILFLDSDMKFPKTILNDLLAAKKDIIAANCTTRSMPPEPVAHDLNGERLYSNGRTGLQKVQQAGLAVCLINADIFRQLRPPFFSMEWIPEYGAYCGEDVYFTQYVKEVLGTDVWVDHTVSRDIKHIGSMAYGHDQVEMPETSIKRVG